MVKRVFLIYLRPNIASLPINFGTTDVFQVLVAEKEIFEAPIFFFFVKEKETFFFTFLFQIAEPGWMKPWVLLAEGLLPTPAPEAAATVLGFQKKIKLKSL